MWAIPVSLLLLFQTANTNPTRDGMLEFGRRNYARAIELLTPIFPKLKQGTPVFNEAALALGQSYFVLGRFTDAAAWLGKRMDAKPRPEADYMLSQALLQTGEYDKARAVLAALYNTEPDSPISRAITARMLIRMARNKEAQAELEAAVITAPTSPELRLILGELTLATNQPETAARHFREAARLDASLPAAWLGMGEAESRLEHWHDAIAALQKSIWLNPHAAQPYVALGKAYLRVKSLANAETMLRKALELDPGNASAQNLLQQVSRQTNH
jgi:tetratricopeptide (TPR) repeat protein